MTAAPEERVGKKLNARVVGARSRATKAERRRKESCRWLRDTGMVWFLALLRVWCLCVCI